MYRFEDLRLRKFQFEDIPLKIRWINDPANHRFLHYDLPLEYEKTCRWFEGVKDRRDRFDAMIEYQGRPVGLIGLLTIDQKNGKAEEYIALGEQDAKGKGVAARAGFLNQLYGFQVLGLNKIYAYTEMENLPAMRLYRSRGFHVDGYLRDDLCMNGRFVDRQLLSLRKADMKTPEGVYWEDNLQMEA